MFDISISFKQYMQSFGIICNSEIIIDGKIHRFHVEGDKAGRKNGWYILYNLHNGLVAGSFWSWNKDGIKVKWCNRNKTELTPQEIKSIAEAHKRIEQEIKKKQQEAKQKASFILSKTKKQIHAYLINKGIQQNGLVYKNCLIVPIYNPAGELTSIQFITANGNKSFLVGGQIKGCYYIIGEPKGKIYICEGIATTLTIHKATQTSVAMVLSANNILPASKAIKSKYPNNEIIICADNDQWTTPNIGMIKAEEAAKVIGAKFIAPCFKDITGKPTDFNDLMQLEGLDEVKRQLSNNIGSPTETLQETIARLAALPPIEYEQIRNKESDRLGFRVSVLDEEVKKLRPLTQSQDNESELENDIEPWDRPVNSNEIALDIEKIFNTHLVLPEHFATTLTLWTINTYCFNCFSICPKLLITSPTKRCGKTTLINILHYITNKALPSSNTSPSSIFRAIECWQPTLLLDEADTFISNSEELRGIINSGHTKNTAFVLRTEGDSRNRKPKRFKTWSPMAIAMIKKPADTIVDRSITINLRRKLKSEKITRLNINGYEKLKHLRMKLKRFAIDNMERLKTIKPDVPNYGNDRTVDNWMPLFALAEILGGEWPSKVRLAYQHLNLTEDEETTNIMLLSDIRNIFAYRGNKVHSHNLVNDLIKLDERPWGELKNGSPITKHWLANTLKDFGVSSKQIRIGIDNKNGYSLADFEDVFSRYLPAPPIQNSTTLQTNKDKACSHFQNSTETKAVEFQNPLKANTGKACRVVEFQKGVHEEIQEEYEVFTV